MIPPPLLFVAAFLLGRLAQRWLGLEQVLALPPMVERIGGVVSAIAVLPALSAVILFLGHRTTIIPHRTSSALVTSGPYRFTRNPMYLSLVVLYSGVALWTSTLVAFALLPLPAWIVNRFVIPMEEAQLRKSFGAAFDKYCQGVRRWL